MKKIFEVLLLLSLSGTIVNAQGCWPNSCSDFGLKGKVHEVVTISLSDPDSTGLYWQTVIETRLYSPEGLITHRFYSCIDFEHSTEYIYDGKKLTDVYYNADAEYHARYHYASDGRPSMIVISAKQMMINIYRDTIFEHISNDTIMVSYKDGKQVFTPSDNLFAHDIFFPDVTYLIPSGEKTDLEDIRYDKSGNWIFKRWDLNMISRHIVYW